MISVEKAIQILQDAISPNKDTIDIPILNAGGMVTAKDIYAPINVPSFSKSAMDGYALRSEDSKGASPETPVTLRVIGEVCPGDTTLYVGQPGTALRIMTGGKIPEGYDCVLAQEYSDYGMDNVQIFEEMKAFDNYCLIGEDLRQGDMVIPRCTRLTGPHIGILASMGCPSVTVIRPLRVGIIATGTELMEPGTDPVGSAHIYCSSNYTMAIHMKNAGVEVAFMEICRDDPDEFCAMVQRLSEQVDAIITTGGVSVGKSDFVPDAIEQLGAVELFRRVVMKPGTPVLASKYKQKLILSFSGNPYAALVNFHLFFWPVLAKAMESDAFLCSRTEAVLFEGTMKPSGLRRFVRAHKAEDGVHLYTNNHRSTVISNLISANCLIDQPAKTALKEGDRVSIICWKD